MQPTVRQLEAFIHVYRLGSVTQAANRMNLTQSTVSVLLRQLEQGLGIALFDRTTRVLAPTAAGHQTLPFAERALREIEQLQATTHDLVTKSSGCVRIATSAAVAASVLPHVLKAFKEAHPRIQIDLRDMAPSELNRSLLERDVDFAVGGWPESISPELNYDLLKSGYLVAARIRTDEPAPDTLSWKELAEEPAVIGVRRASSIRKRIDRELEPLGLRFTPTLEAELLSTVIALTVNGLGVAILPGELIGRQYQGMLTVQRLVEPEVRHDAVLMTRPDVTLPPASEAFVEMLRQALS